MEKTKPTSLKLQTANTIATKDVELFAMSKNNLWNDLKCAK